jgi:hypothetical protein
MLFEIKTLLSVLNPCGRPVEKDTVAVRLRWAPKEKSATMMADTTDPIYLPTTVRGFNCLVLNVTGPDIPSKNPSVSPNIFGSLKDGNACTYPGIISNPTVLSTSQNLDITLQLPVGGERLVQIGGMLNTDGGDCSQIDFNNPATFDQTNGKKFRVFEVGRTLITNLFSPKVVTITNTYDSQNPKRMDCEKVSYENGSATNIEQVVAGHWRGPCDSSSSSTRVFPAISGTLSQQVTMDFGAGSYKVDVTNYKDVTCTAGQEHSFISYRGMVPTFFTTSVGGEFDLDLILGTIKAKATSTVEQGQLFTACGIGVGGTPGTEIDVTGLGGPCKLEIQNQKNLEKLRVTTAGLMFGYILPLGAIARPTGINTGKLYVR